jgi:hypothetical protein
LELIFGRGAFSDHVSIFVGRGGEFCNAEPIATREQALDLADDVRQLASATIVCDEHISRSRAVTAKYKLQFPNGSVVAATFRGQAADTELDGSRRVSYVPWLKPTSG